ncbi:MAG: hypothetical protein RL662_2010 [Bacteroidota bacterium]|jgi:hypothetical protein
MEATIKKISKGYLGRLQSIEHSEGDILQIVPLAIKELEEMFKEIKAFISNYTFKSEEEEIKFFKEIKPQLFSKLIYYQKIYRIEAMRPNGSDEAQKIYIDRGLDRLKVFFDTNLDFYKYYRSDGTHLDRLCFMREKPIMHMHLESFYFERDPKFSSHCDFKVAKLLANELLRIYLNGELHKLEKSEQLSVEKNTFPKVKKTWTRKKTDLVELIYAICETDCFNFGKTNLKRVVGYFENVFNIDLGNPYHTYIEIKDRANRTQFLDELKEKLIRKMDEEDSR